MRLVINGEERFFSEIEAETAQALCETLARQGVFVGTIALEVNKNIVPRAQRAAHRMQDGDVLEIVQFVGGG
jgi:sulfur carrier protein